MCVRHGRTCNSVSSRAQAHRGLELLRPPWPMAQGSTNHSDGASGHGDCLCAAQVLDCLLPRSADSCTYDRSGAAADAWTERSWDGMTCWRSAPCSARQWRSGSATGCWKNVSSRKGWCVDAAPYTHRTSAYAQSHCGSRVLLSSPRSSLSKQPHSPPHVSRMSLWRLASELNAARVLTSRRLSR